MTPQLQVRVQVQAWDEFEAQVLALWSPPVRRAGTRGKMRQVLREFGALCRTTGDLTPMAIAAWIAAHPGRRPATVDSLLRSLRGACTLAARRGHLPANPFEFRPPGQWVDWDVEELPSPVHGSSAISKVLERADAEASGGAWKSARLQALVYTLSFTGARKREVLGLAAADVDLAGGCIAIRPNVRRALKTRGSAAHIPMPPPLAHVLEAWTLLCDSVWLFPGATRRGPWLGGPMGGKASDELKALGLRAGVPGLTCQSLRHTFASLAEGWGIGELALQRLLRHTRIRTQRSYRHELPEVLREAASKVHFA